MKKADSLTEWKSDNENIKTISSLEKHGFKFDKKAPTSTGKLNGKTFVITGTENYSRQDLINLIESWVVLSRLQYLKIQIF